MKKMKEFDKVNAIYGLIATVGAAIFGQYWFLFAGFLLMNFIDYVTGLVKAKRLKKESSSAGAWGVFKKVSYWIVIGMKQYIRPFSFFQIPYIQKIPFIGNFCFRCNIHDNV